MIRSDILKELQNKNKKRTTVWLSPETFEKMDLLLKEDNCNNRSEFIEKALTFYMGYLVSNQTTDYLSKILLGAIQGTLRETENRQSANLFRLSVEMSMMMNILAAGLEISDEDLRKLRGRCVAEVKRNKGRINMEDAVKYQMGTQE
ncbi:hypothetical protein [Anaerotignum sp. MB30-C6]|uniref:hypothetical protein n=1 Tax=Anaerotignum sp. MB30-C6 TaxID=3070814 RepID=UPI0027DE71ED|nr:hypothetical protein [Anaerotignum sp. MB30-C6]WMI82430.1 hypothetical protein RBQ60_06765 [Anaerotignum sp. MB30-C6]